MSLERRKQIALFIGLIFLCGGYAEAQPGVPDPTFGVNGRVTTDFSGASESISDVVIQPDGKIVAVGTAAGASSLDFAVVRYTPSGTLDPGFSGDGIAITPLAANSAEFAA